MLSQCDPQIIAASVTWCKFSLFSVIFNIGVIFGDSYIVTPSASSEIDGASDETEQSELNAQRACKAFVLNPDLQLEENVQIMQFLLDL